MLDIGVFNLNSIKKIIILASATSLSACSFIYGEDGLIRDTSNDYLTAVQTKELVMPEGLSHKAKANYAQVPAIGLKAETSLMGKELRNSAPVQILAVLENVRVDKQSEFPAIFIQDEQDFIWNVLLNLFEENKVSPAILDKSNYFLDTGWMALDERGLWLGIEGSEEVEEFRAKYQIKLTPGILEKEVRVEAKRVRAQKLNDESDKWEDVGSFWQDSAQMLNFIIADYDKQATKREEVNRTSVIAGFKVDLGVDSDGETALLTSAKRELVWNKLPKVLEAVKFEINDKDRRSMTYFLKYEKEEQGFFASLVSSKPEFLPLEDGNYQVAVTDMGENTAITFKDGQGVSLESNTVIKMYPMLSKLFGKKR
jgi:outer membrane protein assembly factor BamC